MQLCTVIGPPQSVHGNPWASPEVHWFHVSLAHDWGTTATLAVLSKTTSYTGGLAARAVATKMPKPGDPSVLGLRAKARCSYARGSRGRAVTAVVVGFVEAAGSVMRAEDLVEYGEGAESVRRPRHSSTRPHPTRPETAKASNQ
jgi:hypothetical protein